MGITFGDHALRYSFWAEQYTVRNKDWQTFSAIFIEFERYISSKYNTKKHAIGHLIYDIESYTDKNIEENDALRIEALQLRAFDMISKYGFGPERLMIDSNRIINAIASNKTLHIEFKTEIKEFLNDEEAVFFDHTTSSKNCCFIKHNDNDAIVLGINYNMPLQLILDQVRRITEAARLCKKDVSELIRVYDEETSGLNTENVLVKSRSGYTNMSDNNRAIGLLLWDSVLSHGGGRGTVKQAIIDLSNAGHIEQLGLEHVDDGDLRYWYRWTDECIKTAEVLPFTKRKKGTQNC